MALSTEKYGYLIDPMLAFTDEHGNTIKNGFLRIFLAGTSTPAVTYANFDGTPNEESIQLDNSGRTATSVIAAKSRLYKVCVYDSEHSQESPIVTKDNVAVGDGGSGEGSVTYIVFGESTEADIRALVDGGSIVILETEEKMVPLYSTASDGIVFRTNELIGDDNDAIEIIDFRVSGSTWTRETKTIDPTALVAEYGTTTATEIQAALEDGRSVYFDDEGTVAMLWKCETDKYTFRTTRTRLVSGVTYLDIVDYVVNGSAWTTVTQTIPGGTQGSAYLKHVSSPSDFDTTGLSGMQTVAGVNDVPADGVYQVSVMLSVTPKTASPTKSDLVFGFYGSDGTGMPNTTFHAVVDDSQTFAQQLSFSTTLNLKAGTNSLKLVCGGFSTQYLVFVDDLSVAQIVNGVYHNGDNFDEVHTLTEALDFNNDDGVLVDGATGGPRFMLWRTLANKVLGFIKSLSTTITAFRTGDVIPVDGPSGTAKMSKDNLLKETAQNALAGNVAPAFDPTKPNDAGGYAYYADEIVAYQGVTYKFKVNHSSGAWNAAEADRYDAGESLKFFVVSNNPEYLYVVTDKGGAFLFGIKKEGSVDWAVGVPKPVRDEIEKKVKSLKDYTDEEVASLVGLLGEKVDKVPGKSLIDETFAAGVSIVQNPEYLKTIVDSNGNLLLGIRYDGDLVFGYGVPTVIKDYVNKVSGENVSKEPGKSLINETFAEGVSVVENPEYLNAIVDALNRVILGVKEDGRFVFKAPVSFDNIKWSQNNLYQLGTALKELGLIRGVGDQSEKSSLHIPMPKFCVINFSNILRMPLTKTEDAQAIMEFWDNSGNYFKKNVIANAQGNSSLVYVKKNVSFDLCNDDWLGDDTFKIKFGEWVEQDSFHLKAYYTDFFRGLAIPAYNFYKEILDTHGNNSDRTWKLALNIDPNNYGQGLGYGESSSVHDRLDNGALCFPQGFPALVYLNGEFYGIFSWNLKKHRDNYHMDKSKKNHIHLDGILGADFFSGNIDWTDFEVRNPKKLICMDGSDYDGDNPAELIDSSSEAYNPNNSKHVFTASVKAKIVALSGRLAEISAAATTEDKKTLFEKYFCSGNLIDYQIFSDVLRNTDGFNKNWQWTTWDGERWFVNAYDLDETFGSHNTGFVIFEPLTSRLGSSSSLPSGVMQSLYSTELDARYAELRASGIIDSNRLSGAISSWCKIVGEKFYKLEFEKWNDSPCNRDMVIAEEWEVVLGDDGKPDISYSGSGEYSPSRTYNVGDVVKFNATSVRWWYQFRCVAQVQGVQPITKFGQRDNLWRVQNWLRISIENMDSVYNYNN